MREKPPLSALLREYLRPCLPVILGQGLATTGPVRIVLDDVGVARPPSDGPATVLRSTPGGHVMTTSPEAGRSSSRGLRWRPRLSIRGLMLLVAVVGGGVGWIGQRARKQRLAVDLITGSGGAVTYDYQLRALQAGRLK